MNNNKKNKAIYIKKIPFLLLLIICTFSSCKQTEKLSTTENVKKKFEQPKELPESEIRFNTDGTADMGEGFVSWAFLDYETEKIVSEGKKIEPIDQKIKGFIEFEQNFPQKNEFLLILMVDFVQQNFYTEGKEYRTYPFSLEGYESIKIEIELPYPEKGKEFSFITIRNPNNKELTLENEDGWDHIFESGSCRSGSFLLTDDFYKEEDYHFDNMYFEFDDGSEIACDLTKDVHEMIVMPNSKSGENVNFALSDELLRETYAIVAFLNWEQVPLQEDKDLFKLVKVKKDKAIYYKITLPEVEEPTPYQIFAFPKPFAPKDKDNYTFEQTFRTIIHKK